MTESDEHGHQHPPGWTLDPATNQWSFDPSSPELTSPAPTEAGWTAPAATPPVPTPYAAAPYGPAPYGPAPYGPAPIGLMPAQPQPQHRKKGRKGKIILIAVGCVVGLAVIGGIAGANGTTSNQPTKAKAVPSSSATSGYTYTPPAIPTEDPTTPDNALTNLTLGEKVEITDDSGADGTVTVKKIATGYVDYDPASHGRYVKVEVTYHCIAGAFSYNELDWSATNAKHHEYQATFAADDELDSGTLHRGGTTTGWVYFDVSTTKITTISYVPNFSGDPLGTWKVHY